MSHKSKIYDLISRFTAIEVLHNKRCILSKKNTTYHFCSYYHPKKVKKMVEPVKNGVLVPLY